MVPVNSASGVVVQSNVSVSTTFIVGLGIGFIVYDSL